MTKYIWLWIIIGILSNIGWHIMGLGRYWNPKEMAKQMFWAALFGPLEFLLGMFVHFYFPKDPRL